MKKGIQTIRKKYQGLRRIMQENPQEFLHFEIGLIIGFGFFILLNSVFGLSTFLVGIPIAIVIIFFLTAVKVLGLEENIQGYIELLEETEGQNTSFDIIPSFPNFFAETVELLNKLSEAFTHLGKAIFENFAIVFPVLLDIQIDIDWLHVNLLYLVRTFFNIVQFAVTYYIFRKIKHKVKRRINEEIDDLKSPKG